MASIDWTEARPFTDIRYEKAEGIAKITINRPDKNKPGTVGPPLENVELKIAEDGEILVRGDGVFQGYLNKPEATAETIDNAGIQAHGDGAQLAAVLFPPLNPILPNEYL